MHSPIPNAPITTARSTAAVSRPRCRRRSTRPPSSPPRGRRAGEHPHAAMSLGELCDRKLREHDHDRVDEEDRADRALRHAHLVLREHREGARSRTCPAKMNSVLSATTPTNDPVPEHVGVAARAARRRARRGATSGHGREQDAQVDEERRRRRSGTARRTCPGRSASAISPPTSAPTPIPRFIITRCIANVAWRRSGGESAASSVDCAGQKKPLPTPVTTAARKPCHGACTRRTPRSRPRGRRVRARGRGVLRPVDERSRDGAGDDADDARSRRRPAPPRRGRCRGRCGGR